MKKSIPVNVRGRRIGEKAPRAKLSDGEIELIEELLKQGLTLREIADRFAPPAKR